MAGMERHRETGKPPWLKVTACGGRRYLEVLSLIREKHLHTVCQEANCPNRGECFSSGTATFMILGRDCTRRCTFCNVRHGRPSAVDPAEAERVAEAASVLELRHVVVTSVTRDDLDDGGAEHFARVIGELRVRCPGASVEVLTPDFKGVEKDIETVLRAGPEVFNHNVETVPELYGEVRPGADYDCSLGVLRSASAAGAAAVKSGVMVGLGESRAQLLRVFRDLQAAGVQYLTIGQYLSPSRAHHPVIRYYHPSEFDDLAAAAEGAGIEHVYSGPLVRSSYHAGEQYFRGQ